MGDVFTFSVPAGLHRVDEILALNRRIQETGKAVRIQAYDTVQGLQWNGGRLLFNKEYSERALENLYTPLTIFDLPEAVARVKRLNDEGISFNLTFNNTLESLDAEDDDGNYLLRHLHNGMNGVTIATESLRGHVAENYPEFERTASICFAYKHVEQYAKACTRYHKVVVMPTFAYEPESLKALPTEKLVFILNDGCFLFCSRKDHYDNISRCSLSGNSTLEEQTRNAPQLGCRGCLSVDPSYREKCLKEFDPKFVSKVEGIRKPELVDSLDPKDRKFAFNISSSARRELLRAGFRTFKLQGRDYLQDQFQSKVIDFLEMIVRDEI